MLGMIAEQLVNGVALGMTYALVAVGYSLVFGILRLVNFAHSAVYAFGAMMCWAGSTFLHLPVLLSLFLSIVITGGLSMLIDRLGLKPLREQKAEGISSLITTIGLSFIIQTALTVAFGSQMQRFDSFLDFGIVYLGGVPISIEQLTITGICGVLLVLLSILVNKTKVGLAMQAVQQNSKAASINGINVNFVITFTFFLGGATAALAGSLVAGYYHYVQPTMGVAMGLKTFAAAVVGGIGSLPGAVLGGLIIGLAESYTMLFLGGSWNDAVAYIILFFVLIFRPTGIWGRQIISKV